MSRTAQLVLAGSLCILAAAGIVTLVVADPSYDPETNLTYTAGGLLVFGAPAAAGLSSRGAYRWVGWLAALSAVAAFGALMGALWSIDDEFDAGSETLIKLFGAFGLFAFGLAYATVALDRSRDDDSRIVSALLAASLLGALAVATLLTIALVGETGGTTYFRIIAVVAVLGVLTGALVPLLRGLRRSA